MAIKGSKDFANQMLLRSSVGGDDLFDDRLLSRWWEDTSSMGFPASAGGNENLGDCMKESQQEFEEEETKKTQILLTSLAAQHWNLRRMKRKEVLNGKWNHSKAEATTTAETVAP